MKTIKNILFISALAVLMSACASKNVVHQKGRHHATHLGKMQTLYASWFSTSVTVDFRDSCWYSPDLIEGNPWNKITGRGGLVYSFKDKVRKTQQTLVWRPIQDSLIEIAYYGRKNYEIYWEVVDTAKISEPKEIPIRGHLRSFVPTGAYFGGREPAPRTMHYRVKRSGFRFIF